MNDFFRMLMQEGTLEIAIVWEGDEEVSFRAIGYDGVYTPDEYREAITRWVKKTFPGREKVGVVVEYDPRGTGVDCYEWREVNVEALTGPLGIG